MADTVKQSPLGINVLGQLLENQGLRINPAVQRYLGSSNSNSSYSPGKLVSETCLYTLTIAINDAYVRGLVDDSTYQSLISVGSDSIPALGNAMPPTYQVVDPSGNWTTRAVKYAETLGVSSPLPGPANAGYPIDTDVDQGQAATWMPYDNGNPNSAITQWGYLRLHALQAWNEFNWNNDDPAGPVDYTEFLSSLMSVDSYIKYNNEAILANQNAKTFADGTYSNMDDMISGDCLGINLSNEAFGADLENLGYALDLSTITEFGFPSTLLKLLGDRNAIVQDLALSLLLNGLEDTVIQKLIIGELETPSIEQEQQIYNAMQNIIGENLQEILAILECRTAGITNLADLLDVKKLLPNSYRTLTVPKYNETLGLPTNSKTYYPIYEGNDINDAITTEVMNLYVGSQMPIRTPSANLNNNTTSQITNVPIGFGSHLLNILPKAQAVAAGAFVFSLRQVKNIDKVSIKDFARACRSLETTRGLNLVNGTSKPTSDIAIQAVQNRQALGSGPYGTYTFSDFFGSMSGLPYAWEKIYDYIFSLQTTTLSDIYTQLYLAVTWEQANATVESVESPAGVWTVTGITIDNPGGGYGRENATPTASVNGVPVTIQYGTNPTDIGSDGAGTFGRILSISLPSGTFGSLPVVTISPPPGPSWPSANTTVQDYVQQVNDEIANIAQEKSDKAAVLNTYWNTLGSQLAIEQRARYIGLTPVSIPKDIFGNRYPSTINVFVDSLSSLAQDTLPHMAVQTIEAISDLSTLGGQSIVAVMRQERNQSRLTSVGAGLDNNIPSTLSEMDTKTLLTNNTIAAGINGSITSPLIQRIINNPSIYGNVLNGVVGFTNPSWPRNEINGQVLFPVPRGKYIPSDTNIIGQYQTAITTQSGDITAILNGEVTPVVSNIVPAQLADEQINFDTISLPYELETGLTVTMDNRYTSGITLPAAYDTREALDKITDCNCDCWVL